ncbi:Integrase family protein (fragment) [uncultured Alphaproteobacteria bacterium]|uniref:Integrase family protein n=1 Tax=uncultured Alphaproteobacteria bacterium TaxID=91750 RepID=A0A212JZJ5_9PROT
MKVLEPIWPTIPKTAKDVQNRIETILDWATVRGYRPADNPARWKGCLDKLFLPPSKVKKEKHHAALAYADVGAFMNVLRQRKEGSARALEFTILTAARTSEALNARWEEFDLDAKVWNIPGERMKGRKDHRIPLSKAAMTVLTKMAEVRQGAFVFPGERKERPFSNMAFLQLLRRIGRADITTHGFRSTFKDWASEQTDFPNEVTEMALAHSIPSKVEAAYRRGDLLDKRQELMEAWGAFCSAPA